MLDELVDAGRLEAGRPLELRRDSTDLVALARQTVAEHQQTTDRHIVHLTTDLPDLVGIWDGVRLGRVLDNLVSNAVKYSPRGGEVEVLVDREDIATPLGGRARERLGRGHPGGGPAAHLRAVPSRSERRGPHSGNRDWPLRACGASWSSTVARSTSRAPWVSGTTVTVRLPLEAA